MTPASPRLAAVPRSRLAAVTAFAVLVALGGARGARAGAAERPPSRTERAAYWLDRLVTGPERTSYAIRSFHQTLLDDAIANLAATPDETLALLAEEPRRARLTSQVDANPWHAVLEVLRQVGATRPDVTRAWALPALENPLLTLRRAAIPPLAGLRSSTDGPTLVAELRRDAEDRVAGPAAARALLALGPPWDAAAARIAYERGPADAPGATGLLWEPMADAIVEAKSPGAADVLAWWATLAAVGGPRAATPDGARPRDASPARAFASPQDLLGVGRGAAAHARAALSERGLAPWRAAVERDAASSDPFVAGVARESLRRTAGPAEFPALREEARALLDAVLVPESRPPPVDEARSLVRTLDRDADPAATALLRRFVLETPATLLRAMLDAYDALAKRGAKPTSDVLRLLASPQRSSVDRATALIRHANDPAYLGPVLAWTEGQTEASQRSSGRRLWLFVLSQALSHGGVDPEVLADGVRRAVEWSKDPRDPSAAGLLGVLLDLGPPGLAAVEDGLRGPDRPVYLALLPPRPGRPLPPSLVDALLAPIDRDTPAPTRRAALDAAFFTAGGDSAEGLRALARRLDDAGSADVETVLSIVAHRVRSDR